MSHHDVYSKYNPIHRWANATPHARLKARRKLWLQVHLYLGLFAGAVLVVIGLTGSILAFWQEIDDWLNPTLYQVETPKDGAVTQRPLTEMVAAAQAAMPAGAKLINIYYPYWPGTAFTISFAPADVVPGVQSDVSS